MKLKINGNEAADMLAGLGGLVVIAVLLILGVIMGTLAGAFVGWVVGWFFSNTILGIAVQFGIKDITMWQLGAFLGFVGSFFRPTITKKD